MEKGFVCPRRRRKGLCLSKTEIEGALFGQGKGVRGFVFAVAVVAMALFGQEGDGGSVFGQSGGDMHFVCAKAEVAGVLLGQGRGGMAYVWPMQSWRGSVWPRRRSQGLCLVKMELEGALFGKG